MQQPLINHDKQYQRDNWLYTAITPLINALNIDTEQLQNEGLKGFKIGESDCDNIIQELKKIMKSTPKNKNVYKVILLHFFAKRTFMIILSGTLKDMLQIGNILLLDLSTTSLREREEGDYWPIVYLLLMIVVDFGKTYIASKILRYSNLIMLRIKVILQYLIFMKSLSTQCFDEQSEDKNQEDDTNYVANLNTLLTADIDQIFLIQYCYKEGWSAFLIIISCFIILFQKDSFAGTIVVVSLIGLSIYNILVSYFIIWAEKKMLKLKDQRASLTTDIIDGIKQIKYLSWQTTFCEKIMQIRRQEFKNLAILKIFDGLCALFWSNISYCLLFIYITAVLRDGRPLQDLNIFTLIAIFNTLTFPLGILPWCFNYFMLAWVSLKRIKTFLLLPDIDPLNRFLIGYPAQPTQVLLMEDLTFQWPNNENSTEQTQISADQVQDIDETNDETTKFMLRIDKLEIQHNSLNFVVGRIGSGKTALFNAILNELSKDTQYNQQSKSILTHNSFAGERLMTICDQIIIKGSLGYCSQTTWVQNATIRQNILFGKEYDAYSYKMCIEACELQKDLSLFEKGDLHEIGPDGKNLSGGQKQRITLARAFYQDSDIYLLDDVFSSLDVHVADIVFKKSIIDYLITKGKTVLLITSHYRYIQLAKNYLQPNIIYIDNGQIIDDQQVINEFIEDQTKKEEEQEIEESIEEEIQQMIPTLRKQHSSIKQMEYHHKNEYDDAEESEEQREQGKIDSSTWIMYFSNMNWILFITFIIICFLTQASMSLIDFWLKSELNQSTSWLHKLTLFFDNDFQTTFILLIVLLIVITLLSEVFYVLTSLVSAWQIFSKLNSSIIWSVMTFFDHNNPGRIINRIQDDTYMVDDDLPWVLHMLLEQLCMVIGFSIGLTILFPVLGLGIIGIIFMYYQVSKIYTKANRELKRLKSINSGKVLALLNETISGIKTIRAFSKQSYFEDTYINKLSQMILSEQCAERSKQWFDVRLLLLSNLLLVFVVILISTLLLTGVDIDYAQCALTLTYSLIILECCYLTFDFYLQLEQHMISFERIKQYYINPQESLDELIGAKKQLTKDNILKLYKQQEFQAYQCDNIADSVIMFKNVFLTYDDPTLSTTKLALKNVSFTIGKGEKIAFVGRTGSGKTSILNTLFRMYDIQYGEIYINGQNTINMTLKQLRQQMSVVPQFGFLYNATIKDNLDPQNLNTSEEIERLFEETGFTLRGIKADKQQCNTNFMVSANGGNLSNGEKQVINFLRVMLQNKQIVCLDEATSNMDPQTDQLLHKLLFKYVEDRTLIVITHRLENIGCYDRIVVMEQGEIVEQGSFNELLQIEGGFFNRLMDHHKEQMK